MKRRYKHDILIKNIVPNVYILFIRRKREMNKKLAVKLIATVMAMAMVVGMGMSVLAAEPAPTHAQAKANIGPKITSSSSMPVFPESDDVNTLPAGTEVYSDSKLSSFQITAQPFMSDLDNCGHETTATLETTELDTYNSILTLWDGLVASRRVSDGSNWVDCHSGSASPSTPAAPTAEEIAAEAVKVVEATIKAEEALPVTSFASAAAVAAIPAEAKAAGTTATMNISNVTTSQGFVAAVKKIATASAAAPSVSVYSSKPIALNAASVNAISNTNKPFVYTFNYKGRLYRVTIPAGAKVNFGKTGFVGPLGIGAQFGTTEVLK